MSHFTPDEPIDAADLTTDGSDLTRDDAAEPQFLRSTSADSRRARRLKVLLGVVAVMLLLAGGGGVWVQRQIDPPGAPGELREIEIPVGSTSDDIGKLLADEGIIASDTVWRWYLRVRGGGPFEAGVYELAENSAIGDVIDVLEAGPRPPEERRFTVPEGLTTDETLARLADPDKGLGLDLATMERLLASGEVRSNYQPAGVTSTEGILFPETYRVADDADERAVLEMMVGQLDATMAGLGVEVAQDRFNLTPYEVLIMASLIEEEAKVPEERPKMARVMYNRLEGRIPLGIDATSRYEAILDGRDRGDIDFSSDSPYNTRRVQGLPPTPIASPGRASLEAALNPADGPWIYYVLEDADGHHFFTESDREFLKAKKRCAERGLGCG